MSILHEARLEIFEELTALNAIDNLLDAATGLYEIAATQPMNAHTVVACECLQVALAPYGMQMEGTPSMEGVLDWIGKLVGGLIKRVKSFGSKIAKWYKGLFEELVGLENRIESTQKALNAAKEGDIAGQTMSRVDWSGYLTIDRKVPRDIDKHLAQYRKNMIQPNGAKAVVDELAVVSKLQKAVEAYKGDEIVPFTRKLTDLIEPLAEAVEKHLLGATKPYKAQKVRHLVKHQGTLRRTPVFPGDRAIWIGIKESKKHKGQTYISDFWRGAIEEEYGREVNTRDLTVEVRSLKECDALLREADAHLKMLRSLEPIWKGLTDLANGPITQAANWMIVRADMERQSKEFVDALIGIFRYILQTFRATSTVFFWYSDEGWTQANGAVALAKRSIEVNNKRAKK